ncbi:hypothetical protein C0J52_10763 [Blattella germanica]|nr:hypothetical protein C0J52_10763 [Blattella germanica]
MAVSYVMRFKILAFFVVCFIMWEALRHFPFEDPSQQELNYRWETVIPSMNTALSPVSLSIFYEALCPDSRSFFTKQLLPTFEKIPQLLQTESVESGFSFSCQHGPLECQANKIHACAVSKIPQQDLQLKYTTCMISDNMNPMKIGEQYSYDGVILVATVSNPGRQNCMLSLIFTYSLLQSQDNQPALLKNLFKEVCNHLQEQVSIIFSFTILRNSLR